MKQNDSILKSCGWNILGDTILFVAAVSMTVAWTYNCNNANKTFLHGHSRPLKSKEPNQNEESTSNATAVDNNKITISNRMDSHFSSTYNTNLSNYFGLKSIYNLVPPKPVSLFLSYIVVNWVKQSTNPPKTIIYYTWKETSPSTKQMVPMHEYHQHEQIYHGTFCQIVQTILPIVLDSLAVGILYSYFQSNLRLNSSNAKKQDDDGYHHQDQTSTESTKHPERSTMESSFVESNSPPQQQQTTEQEEQHPLTHKNEDETSFHFSSPPANGVSSSSGRYLELLVHNVSHTDLVLSLDAPPLTSSTPSLPPESSNDDTRGDTRTCSQSSKTTTETNLSMPTLKKLPSSSSLSSTKLLTANVYNDSLYCLCRPRFSAFDTYSKRILESLANDKLHGATRKDLLVSIPRYERAYDNPRYDIRREQPSEKTEKVPIGFVLPSSEDDRAKDPKQLCSINAEELRDLRVRGRDAPRIFGDSPSTLITSITATNISSPTNDTIQKGQEQVQEQEQLVPSLKLNAVFFPLLATLLTRWHAQISQKYSNSSTTSSNSSQQPKKVLILVTGVGTPRNWTHSVSGNSTEKCAHVMELFIKTLYPDITVVKIHSETNIFRYDDNILFVQRELLPCIQAYRDAHARGIPYPDEMSSTSIAPTSPPFSPEWRKSFAVTISFADGSPARNHAIQAALRSYKPTYFHFWQLKTFWHESKLVDSDIEVHSFEEMETLPAIETSALFSTKNRSFDANPLCSLTPSSSVANYDLMEQVVREMQSFRRDIAKVFEEGKHDINKFWLRKTHKPVLAVLAVETKDDDKGQQGDDDSKNKSNACSYTIKLYRGTNMEVSMPTGSLCAERNVIGTALAANPALKREDLKMIAVLAVPQAELQDQNKQKGAQQQQKAQQNLVSSAKPSTQPIRRSLSTASIIDAEMTPASFLTVPVIASTTQSSSTLRPRPIASLQQLDASRVTALNRDNGAASSSIHEAKTCRSVFGTSPSLGSEPAEHGWRIAPDGEDYVVATPPSLLVHPMTSTQLTSMLPPLVPSNLALGKAAVPSLPPATTSPSSTPVRRIALYNTTSASSYDSNQKLTMGAAGTRKHKRTVVVHSAEDLNPLRPCGACNEWLKKIAESNPYFQILTFTDTDCNGVYCTPCCED